MLIRTDKIWPRDENGFVNIAIGFYNPSGRYRKEVSAVKKIVEEWEDAVPNLRLEWRTYRKIQSCQVRIMFDHDTSRNPWSEIGPRAEDSDTSEPTMELKPIDEPTKDLWEGAVRHEFGHMLGAHHEHQSPEFPWNFNRGTINNRRLSLRSLDTNILFRFKPNDKVKYSGFDIESVMLYDFDVGELTERDNNFPTRSIPVNSKISEIDKWFMRMVYDPSEPCANLISPINSPPALPSAVAFFSAANNLCGDPNCIPGGPTMCARDRNRLTNICGNPECGVGGTFICTEDLRRSIQLVQGCY